MKRLAVNIVSRGRPQLLWTTVEHVLKNATSSDTVVMVSLDQDDPTTSENLLSVHDPRLIVDIREREDTLGAKYNRVSEFDADLYLPMADHSLPSESFDEAMLEAARTWPDGICAVHGSMANGAFANFQAYTRKWIAITGEIAPEIFPYWFWDHWTNDVAFMVGRVAYANCTNEAAAVRKPSTQELRDVTWWSTLFDALYPVRKEYALSLIRAMDETQEVKQNLMRGFPSWEVKSKVLSHATRMESRYIPSPNKGPDERYLRVRARAIELFETWKDRLPYVDRRLYETQLVGRAPTSFAWVA